MTKTSDIIEDIFAPAEDEADTQELAPIGSVPSAENGYADASTMLRRMLQNRSKYARSVSTETPVKKCTDKQQVRETNTKEVNEDNCPEERRKRRHCKAAQRSTKGAKSTLIAETRYELRWIPRKAIEIKTALSFTSERIWNCEVIVRFMAAFNGVNDGINIEKNAVRIKLPVAPIYVRTLCNLVGKRKAGAGS